MIRTYGFCTTLSLLLLVSPASAADTNSTAAGSIQVAMVTKAPQPPDLTFNPSPKLDHRMIWNLPPQRRYQKASQRVELRVGNWRVRPGPITRMCAGCPQRE